jgi:hypothetical protein
MASPSVYQSTSESHQQGDLQPANQAVHVALVCKVSTLYKPIERGPPLKVAQLGGQYEGLEDLNGSACSLCSATCVFSSYS